ncbi:MAG TPA: YkgJ family cysteine cluster protein [Candidatus Acidoferrales bacterium]|nr:YkgJ family cysteine cluster protein [Candidatus Acidoferrales bacterium]
MSRTHTNFAYPRNVWFECTRCGLCCGDTKMRTRHILLLKKEAEKISETTSRPVEDFACRTEGHEPYEYEMRKSISGKCLFLEGDTCIIYALRPLVCRYYPFELRALQNGRFCFSSTKECPGMGRGRLLGKVYFEELLRLARNQIG